MSKVCLVLVKYWDLSLAEILEGLVVMEEPLQVLRLQELVVQSLLMGPEVEVLELWSNCTGIPELCLLLQSRIGRCLLSRILYTVFAPQMLTVQKCYHAVIFHFTQET
jgi:hypothetical protein